MPTPEETTVLRLALKVALLSVALSLPVALPLAWVLARWRSPVVGLLRAVLMLPLVLPPVVTGYLLLLALGRASPVGRALHQLTGVHIAYTQVACVLAAAVVGFPLLVESLRLALLGVDRRLEQVSRSLGRGRLETWWRITLPLCRPGLLAGIVLAFARALGEFGATIVLAGNIPGETRQIPLAVYVLLNQPGREDEVVRLVSFSVALSLAALLGVGLLARQRARREGRR